MKITPKVRRFIVVALILTAGFWVPVRILLAMQPSTSDSSSSDPVAQQTAEVSTPTPSPSQTNDQEKTILENATRKDIQNVLTVYFATPSGRKIGPEDVKSVTTARMNENLVELEQDVPPEVKASIKSMRIFASGLVTNESVLTTNAIVTTKNVTYGDKSELVSEASITLVKDSNGNWVIDTIEEVAVEER